jgi:L-aspartate oxidase
MAELDLLVIGSGVAGLTAAVRAASAHRLRVGVITKGILHQSATRWAQGGVAAVINEDPDSTDLHLADTLAAGAGLCDLAAVRVLVDEGPARVNELIAMGAMFDRADDGAYLLAREGGHSLPRILHAGGAATGAEIERALVIAAHDTATTLIEHAFAEHLLLESGRCAGVSVRTADGSATEVTARHVLLAAGGAGQLFAVTTNPVEATGDGIAMALEAGVALADVEFVQFHPTALHHPSMPRPLLSEALRGHGALLRDAHGERFVDELQPRDVVARAMMRQMLAADVDHCFLDATGLDDFTLRFPTIAASLAEVGLDPATDWLPIAPAAHYTCGGILTDLNGASSLPGLWAAGEVACSGVHGANRLASNSLLEGMVFAPRAVDALADGVDGPHPTGAMRSLLDPTADRVGGQRLAPPEPPPWGETTVEEVAALRSRLQSAMTRGAGVLRDGASLDGTGQALDQVARRMGPRATNPAEVELRNLVLLGRAVVDASTARTESRGAHTRDDHPETDDRHWLVRQVIAGNGRAAPSGAS